MTFKTHWYIKWKWLTYQGLKFNLILNIPLVSKIMERVLLLPFILMEISMLYCCLCKLQIYEHSDKSVGSSHCLIPKDNPSDFSYFFDTSRRRCCYIAPERFVESGLKNQEGAGQTIDLTSNDEVKSGEITPPMDIFSAGSVYWYINNCIINCVICWNTFWFLNVAPLLIIMHTIKHSYLIIMRSINLL